MKPFTGIEFVAGMTSGRIPIIDLFAGPGGLGEGFAAYCANAGRPAYRIALSVEKDEVAHRTLELRAFFRQFTPGEAPRDYYEHLRDPVSVIQAIHDCLKPGGVLLCDTGLGHIVWERFLPGHSQWYDAPQHLFVFSEDGLVSLLEKCGFSIIHFDANFERSWMRRWVRWFRHFLICFVGWVFLGPLLGRRGLQNMRREAKWPLGRLMSVVAQKKVATLTV